MFFNFRVPGKAFRAFMKAASFAARWWWTEPIEALPEVWAHHQS